MGRKESDTKPGPETLNGFLRIQIEEKGWTLATVSEITGNSPSYASKVFSGKIHEPSARFTIYLSKALGLEIDDLYPFCLAPLEKEVSEKLDLLSDKLPEKLLGVLKATQPNNVVENKFYLRLLENLKQL